MSLVLLGLHHALQIFSFTQNGLTVLGCVPLIYMVSGLFTTTLY